MLAFEINSKLKIGFDSIIANKIYTIVLEQNPEGFLEKRGMVFYLNGQEQLVPFAWLRCSHDDALGHCS